PFDHVVELGLERVAQLPHAIGGHIPRASAPLDRLVEVLSELPKLGELELFGGGRGRDGALDATREQLGPRRLESFPERLQLPFELRRYLVEVAEPAPPIRRNHLVRPSE